MCYPSPPFKLLRSLSPFPPPHSLQSWNYKKKKKEEEEKEKLVLWL
jgi:hypothetical protein